MKSHPELSSTKATAVSSRLGERVYLTPAQPVGIMPRVIIRTHQACCWTLCCRTANSLCPGAVRMI
jgi:hypothetical protein